MRLIISDEQPVDDSWLYVPDVNLLDVFVENSEAKEIVVDFFLGNFYFAEIPSVIEKICRKLRFGGQITIIDMDFEFLCHKLEYEEIQRINQVVFDKKPIKSFYNIEYIKSLLEKYVKITNAYFDDNNNFVLVGERC
jgi:predicted SAM-dependent methyltransferase